jgi:diacylglycerol kinase
MIDLHRAARSFRFAGKGMVDLFRFENNARIHLAAASLVVLAGFFFGLSATEWAIVLIQITLVWMAEAFNTALEKLSDLISPEYHPVIKAVKDLAAGGVLLAALSAVVVGALVFLPKVILLF